MGIFKIIKNDTCNIEWNSYFLKFLFNNFGSPIKKIILKLKKLKTFKNTSIFLNKKYLRRKQITKPSKIPSSFWKVGILIYFDLNIYKKSKKI